MKHINYLIGILFTSVALSPFINAGEMSLDEKINSAMSAAPTRISSNATIQDNDGTVLRKGNNHWTCIPGGLPGTDDYPMCHDPVWMKWKNTAAKGKPFFTEIIGYSYMLQGGEVIDINNPYAKDPKAGGNWHKEGPHMMLLMPNRDLLKGQPTTPKDNSIFVLWKDTPLVMVVIPLGEKP